MLTATFAAAKGMNEELERALWARGVLDWELARAHPEEVAEAVGGSRAGKLAEHIVEAQQALAKHDRAWFRANFTYDHEAWRLWRGYAAPERIALVDIETTGLTPGYDQITVIGLADRNGSRAFVAKPMPGDEPLDRFPQAIRDYDLIVTFNGENFDLPFIERQFREGGFRFDLPHIDLLVLSRSLGITGGLKDIEKQLGISRGGDIANMRGNEAIALWGAWRNQGDANAYRRLVTYCKADCVNLWELADLLYGRRWEKVHTAHAKAVDFAKTKGQQLSIF